MDEKRETVVGFTHDLKSLLDSAKERADDWMQQHSAIVDQLKHIQNTAATLLGQIGNKAEAAHAVTTPTRIRPRRHASKRVVPKRAAAKSREHASRRVVSEETRAKMRASQRARWARLRRTRGE
jgi:hypothetical protein